jgi:hypothetical protein
VNEPKRKTRPWSRRLLSEIEFCRYDHRKLSADRSHGWLLYIGKRGVNFTRSFAVIGKHYAEDLHAHGSTSASSSSPSTRERCVGG